MKQLHDPFTPTPARFHLRVEQTLAQCEENDGQRHVLRISSTLIAALLALAALTGYAAYTHFETSVDWRGRVTREEVPLEEPSPAATPSPAVAALDNVPEGEEWSVLRPNGSRQWCPVLHTVSDLERFRLLLYDTPLPMPNLPEGYELVQAAIRMPVEETPYSETVLAGEILQKRRMQPLYAGGALEYRLNLQTADGSRLYISCEQLPLERENTSFGLRPSDVYEPIDVRSSGWTHGMYIAHNDGSSFVTMQLVGPEALIELTVRADSANVSKEALLAIVPDGALTRAAFLH